MHGHVIADGLIAVDFWNPDAARYFFLTHCHADHLSPRLRAWRRPLIHTSPLNARLLAATYHVPAACFVELALDETVVVGDDRPGEDGFQVTALDAHHCPGSVMLLFQGSFGTILYTGDVRFHPDMLRSPALQFAVTQSGIDQLYLDNTYCAPECVFPDRDDVLPRVTAYVTRWGIDTSIYIGMHGLGKEEVLVAISQALNGEKIWVSESRLVVLRMVLPSVDMFTTDASQSRIHVVPFRNIASYVNAEDGSDAPRLCLLLTAMFAGWPGSRPFRRGEVQLFPYSDHSSYPELCQFVSQLRPRRVLPIVRRWSNSGWLADMDKSARSNMSVFRTYLSVSDSTHGSNGVRSSDVDRHPPKKESALKKAGKRRLFKAGATPNIPRCRERNDLLKLHHVLPRKPSPHGGSAKQIESLSSALPQTGCPALYKSADIFKCTASQPMTEQCEPGLVESSTQTADSRKRDVSSPAQSADEIVLSVSCRESISENGQTIEASSSENARANEPAARGESPRKQRSNIEVVESPKSMVSVTLMPFSLTEKYIDLDGEENTSSWEHIGKKISVTDDNLLQTCSVSEPCLRGDAPVPTEDDQEEALAWLLGRQQQASVEEELERCWKHTDDFPCTAFDKEGVAISFHPKHIIHNRAELQHYLTGVQNK